MAQLFMLCRQLGVILSSIVIARSLSLADVGVFEMLMLCGYLMTFFWSDALLKGYLANPSGAMEQHSSSSFLWFFIIAAFVSMGLLLVGQSILLPLFVGRQALSGIGLFALYQAFIVPLWIAPFIGVLKRHNAFLISIYVLVGPSVACWIGFHAGAALSGVLMGLICYALVGLCWVVVQTKFVTRINLRKLLHALWPVTWPLAMYAISAGLARSFDLWLVAREFSEATFAFFRYGAREFPIVVAFAAGLSTVMIPRLKSNEALKELKQRSTRLMHIAYPGVALVMVLSPILFTFFFGEAYRASAIIFNVYLLLALTQLIFPQSILIAREETKVLWFVSLAELMINVIASLILLNVFGLVGIAFGTLIAFASEKLILMVLVYRKYDISPSRLVNPFVWLVYSSLLVSTFIFSQWMFGI